MTKKNEFSLEPNKKYLTNSEMQIFRKCKRAWQYKHLLELSADKETPEALHIGSKVHDGLEQWYKTQDLELALNASLSSTNNMPKILVKDYIEWTQKTRVDENLKIIGVEKAITAPIVSDYYYLLGKVDLHFEDETNGAQYYMDHKTASNFSIAKTINMNPQFKQYALIASLNESEEGAQPLAGSLVNIIKKGKRTSRSKPPFYMRLEIYHNQSILDNYKKSVISLIEEMERAKNIDRAGEILDPTFGLHCDWCEYKDVCEAQDDDSLDHESIINFSFIKHDPLERYRK